MFEVQKCMHAYMFLSTLGQFGITHVCLKYINGKFGIIHVCLTSINGNMMLSFGKFKIRW